MSGRRTTLVWRRRRFECDNCGERHLEDHAQFQGGLTRRFARRLVADARVMPIRAASRHHGVGWHRIMGLVRAEAVRVAERRRARPCRVLLVDETSIRRRHRYATVVACGDTGQVLAMIPGRTKESLARFFRDQGAWWCRQVETVVTDGSRPYHPDHRTIPTRRSPCARQVPRSALVHPRPHPGTTRDTTPRPPTPAPNIRAGPVPSPLHPPTPSRPPNRSPPKAPRPPVRRPSMSTNRVRMLYQLYEADNPNRANATLGRFADLYATGQTPRIPRHCGHHHRMGRTDPRLPHHKTSNQRTHRRNQQPPPSPTTRRPRVHQPQQLPSPKNPRNMTATPTTATPDPTKSRRAGL